MYDSLEEMLPLCDYVTIHIPATDSTKGMFNKQLLHKVKRGAAIINFSRGGLVEDEAMLSALSMGRVGCYVTDFADDTLLQQPEAAGSSGRFVK